MNKIFFKTLVTKFSNKKILVIGDVGIDKYTFGSVNRISPEAPVPVLNVTEEKLKLGLAANVAENIDSLNASASLVGLIGKDETGKSLQSLYKKGFFIVDDKRPTIIKERVVCERQQLIRIDKEIIKSIDKKIEKKAWQTIKPLISKNDAIIIEDYAKGFLSKNLCRKIIKEANIQEKIIAVDPNTKTKIDYFINSTFLTPNIKEAEYLSGVQIKDNVSLEKAGFNILKKTKSKFVIITCGKDGMAIFQKNSVTQIPTFAKEVFDVSGAGDTVISVLTLALLCDASIYYAAMLANKAAGFVVSKQGTAVITSDELQKQLEI